MSKKIKKPQGGLCSPSLFRSQRQRSPRPEIAQAPHSIISYLKRFVKRFFENFPKSFFQKSIDNPETMCYNKDNKKRGTTE